MRMNINIYSLKVVVLCGHVYLSYLVTASEPNKVGSIVLPPTLTRFGSMFSLELLYYRIVDL